MRDHGNNLLIGIILNGIFTVLEVVVGILSNSLTVTADALHDFTDTIALGLAWFANRKAKKPANERKTWGYYRATILAAFINSLALSLLTIYIFYRALVRLRSPEPVVGEYVLGLAVVGIMVNGFVALRFRHAHDLSARSVFWHIAEDALGWVAVLIAGIVMTYTDLYIIDPILSIIIGIIVLRGAWNILMESTNILLEAVPKQLDLADVEKKVTSTKEVKSIHELHIWSLDAQRYAASMHAVIDDMSVCDTNTITKRIQKALREFNIHHATIAYESEDCPYENMH